MGEYTECMHVFQPCYVWAADQSIGNGASLTSPEWDTHRNMTGGSLAAASAQRVDGIVPIAARFVLGIRLDAAAVHTVTISGGVASGALFTVETFAPGAVQIDGIVREIFWPYLQLTVNNTSAAPRTFRICLRLFPFGRGV
jgi:hypothetical protein